MVVKMLRFWVGFWLLMWMLGDKLLKVGMGGEFDLKIGNLY